MKTLLKSILPVVALFVVTINVKAVEYVTLTKNSPSLNVSPSALVEIVGGDPKNLTITFADGWTQGIFTDTLLGDDNKLTNVTKLSISEVNSSGFITFKITPANELNVVSPTSLLVLPENSTGDYDVLLETSSDAGTWSPFLSQTVSAADAKRFFRARIVKKN